MNSCKPIATPENVSKFLEGLGSDKFGIACSLRSLGIKGRRRNGLNCPIKNLLSQTFEGADTLYVLRESIVDVKEKNRPYAFLEADPFIKNPPAVRDFIGSFDIQEEYPELLDAPKDPA